MFSMSASSAMLGFSMTTSSSWHITPTKKKNETKPLKLFYIDK